MLYDLQHWIDQSIQSLNCGINMSWGGPHEDEINMYVWEEMWSTLTSA